MKGDLAGNFDWLVKTNPNRNIVRYKEVYRVKRALAKTSVIARQKYDYIYYSIPLSNNLLPSDKVTICLV